MAKQSNVPMTSETSICSQALSWVGQSEISSLEEKTKNAQWCRNNYPQLRDAVLEERPWTFARDRQEDTTTNLDGWGKQYRHDIPLNWLWVPRVFRDISSNDPNEWVPALGWVREGQYILTYEAKVYMEGTLRITDTGQFSMLFTQALTQRMAAEMALPLAQNQKLHDSHWATYREKLAIATTRDGQQGRNERLRRGSLVKQRRR